VLFRIGLFELVRAVSNRLRGAAVILCYHRVVEGDPDPYSIPGTQIDLQRFIAQVRGLCRKYRIIPFSLMLEKLKKGILDPDALVLSFDDGFKDNFTIAYPVLRSYGSPAVFFISPEMLGSRSLIWNNRAWFLLNQGTRRGFLQWRNQKLALASELERLRARNVINQTLAPLKEEDREPLLKEIADRLSSPLRPSEESEIMLNHENLCDMIAGGLAEFGSHSLTHPLLPICDEMQRTQEVADSRKKLEKVLGRPVAYFAYPGGAFNEKTIQSVRNAGYEAAVITKDGLVRTGDDLFLLQRVNVVRDDTLASLMIRKLVPLYLRNIGSELKKRLYGDSRD
jgi:peptidoglycan/xylan/chitin deacetylase (PgdA/CDA1 family)